MPLHIRAEVSFQELSPAMTPQQVNLKNPGLAAFLAWLVPGLGHWYQGRRGKAILYFVCIYGLFITGMVMGQGKIVFWRWVNPLQDSENFRIWYPAQFWAGLIALPALIQATLIKYGFNPILGGYLAEPSLNVINALHKDAGRFVDIGVVYTSIAGLLNVLAIYDAYEGPWLLNQEADAEPKAQTPTPNVVVAEGPALSVEPGA